MWEYYSDQTHFILSPSNSFYTKWLVTINWDSFQVSSYWFLWASSFALSDPPTIATCTLLFCPVSFKFLSSDKTWSACTFRVESYIYCSNFSKAKKLVQSSPFNQCFSCPHIISNKSSTITEGGPWTLPPYLWF